MEGVTRCARSEAGGGSGGSGGGDGRGPVVNLEAARRAERAEAALDDATMLLERKEAEECDALRRRLRALEVGAGAGGPTHAPFDRPLLPPILATAVLAGTTTSSMMYAQQRGRKRSSVDAMRASKCATLVACGLLNRCPVVASCSMRMRLRLVYRQQCVGARPGRPLRRWQRSAHPLCIIYLPEAGHFNTRRTMRPRGFKRCSADGSSGEAYVAAVAAMVV